MTATATPVKRIEDGRYTLVYKTGDYRTVWIRTQKEGKWAAGATVLKLKQGHDWVGCGFLGPENKVRFWKSFQAVNQPQRLELIQKAVDRIAQDPSAAGMAFALKENCCCKCGKELTVPASLHRGMGPECYRKTVKKEDNRQAYLWRSNQGSGTKTTVPVPKSPVDHVSSSGNQVVDDNSECVGPFSFIQETAPFVDDFQMKIEFANREREQEARAHMSVSDLPGAEFWSEPCGICRQPRNKCSC